MLCGVSSITILDLGVNNVFKKLIDFNISRHDLTVYILSY